MVGDGSRNGECEVAAGADARVILHVVLGAPGAIPSQSLGEVRTLRVEDRWLREQPVVTIGDGEDVLIQHTLRRHKLRPSDVDGAGLLEHLCRARHRRVHAAGLPDVGLRILLVGSLHCVHVRVFHEADRAGIALLWLLHLQERAHALDARARAANARETDDVHDLVSELHGWVPLPPGRQGLVHFREHARQVVPYDDVHGIDAQLLHLVDAVIENEALDKARQDEERRVGTPASQDLSLVLRDPHVEHHEHDALRHGLLHLARIVEVRQLRVRPRLGHLTLHLPQAPRVRRGVRVEQGLVEDLTDRSPLGVRAVAQEDEDVRGKQVRNASDYAAKGRLTLLLGPQDLVAILVQGTPDALSVPIVLPVAEGFPLPEEKREAAPPVGHKRHQAADHVLPPDPCHVQRPAGLDRAVR
mmetsp:Transcript_38818/g.100349  ORF Transcript_38818/g.100349 Transcript_38818/m.100349 type:complete len:415 (-) Transcript_38818:309-1553(-)